MRLSIFLLLIASHVCAGTFAQKVTLKARDITLAQAFNSIKQQTGYSFFWDQQLLDKAPLISISVTDVPITEALDKVLKGLPLTYEIKGKIAFITAKNTAVLPPGTTVPPDANYDVSGTVKDEKGNPLQGASLRLLPFNQQQQTNAAGEFRFNNVPEGTYTLEVSYISFATFTRTLVVANKHMTVNVVMKPSDEMQEAVTISTGYQNIDKRKLTGAVFTLKGEEINRAGAVNIDGLLQGKVPGLSVITNSGSPSATPTLRIRGNSTFVGSGTPLWVVDGLIQEDPVNLTPLQTDIVLSQARTANFSIIGNAIAGVNPNDIESISFLKDAAAASIYGARAANGVIVVTTRRGKSGTTYFNYNGDFGFTARPTYNKLNLMNSKERIDVSHEIIKENLPYAAAPFPTSYEGLVYKLWNREITQAEFDKQSAALQSMNTNWFDHLFRNAFNQNHQISIAGGAPRNTYYASLSYDDSKGSAIGDDLTRYAALLRLNLQPTDRLKLDFKMNAWLRSAKGFYTINPYDYAISTSRALHPDSTYPVINANIGSNDFTTTAPLNFNFINERKQTGNTSDNKGVQGILTLQYRILKNLQFESVGGISYQNTESKQWASENSFHIAKLRGYNYGSVIPGSDAEKSSLLPFGGILNYLSANNTTWTLRNSLTWSKSLFNGAHLLSLYGGQELRSVINKGYATEEWGYFPDRGKRISYDPPAGLTSSSLRPAMPIVTDNVQNYLSWIANASYSIDSRYIFNAGLRTDASNRFGQYTNNRFQPAYSLSARWNIAEEDFLFNNKIISMLNLRASYGVQGNVVTAVGPDIIAYYPTSGQDRLIDPRSSQYLLRLRSLGYPDLRWEKTYQLNIGVDAGILNNRVNLVADFYRKDSRDLLLLMNLPFEFGYTGLGGQNNGDALTQAPPAMYVNAARVTNYGIEGRIEVVPVRTKEWDWSIVVNVSRNANRAASTGNRTNEIDFLMGNAVVNGKAANGLWSYSFKGLNPVNGLPMFNNMDLGDKPTAYKKNPANFLVYSGKSIPDLTGGIQTQVRYQRFQFMAGFSYSLGSVRRLNPLYGRTFNGPRSAPQPEVNLSKELVNRWQKPGDEAHTNIPVLTNKGDSKDQWYLLPNGGRAWAYWMYEMSDARIVSGDFLRCTNMSLSYALPEKLLQAYKVKNASVMVSGNNLFVIADKKLNGQDPETVGLGAAALPILPSWYLSVKLGF
ncbi:MAG: SusC/RagA family TonB-linked outer membrane protein [Chitinophagaceae bacterium]|nr:SusC/RagA family TonB-linked outer membrane protein [Chitinophagaceae bacterium]